MFKIHFKIIHTISFLKLHMKNLVLIISLLFVASLSNSCKKDKDEPILPETSLTPEKTAVRTFELIYVKAGAEVADSYPATFGPASVTLNKSSDSTLFFIVPDIAAGNAQLNFELGSVQFTVAQTPEIIPNNVFTAILQTLDADIAAMSSDTAPDLAAIDTMLAFKAAMTAQFQALTEAEKRLNCMVYEANKNRFDAFRNSFDITFDIAPQFRIGSISGCPDSPKKEKFTCFAKEIAFNAYVLSKELHTAVNIIETDNVFGRFIPAAYLLLAGQRSRIIDMRSYLTALLNKKWIIDERMYNGVPTTYNNEEYTPLNLNPTVRTINPSEDVFLNLSDIRLFDNISDLKFNWDRLPFLGAFPPYVNAEEPTSFNIDLGLLALEVTNVSPNVELLTTATGITANDVDLKFKTISGLTETFSFTLNFEKDGFLVTKRIENATLIGGGCGTTTSMTDASGNEYPVVQIGNQCWTKENLRTSKYADGSVIPNVTSDAAWTGLSSGAWCNYENSPTNDITYGKLYNWYTVADPRNVCPTGWHVPPDAEWTALTDFLGGGPVAGGKMKTTTGWESPNTAATNESGFSGLPGGYRSYYTGPFYRVGTTGFWWSSSESSTTDAWARNLDYDSGSAGWFNCSKQFGLSVRCLRD